VSPLLQLEVGNMERLESDADGRADIAEDHDGKNTRVVGAGLSRFVSHWQMPARDTSIGNGMSSWRVGDGVGDAHSGLR
jgi:hypothetical protein